MNNALLQWILKEFVGRLEHQKIQGSNPIRPH
jgi:hypothetical protein